jgi:hypothetical protein
MKLFIKINGYSTIWGEYTDMKRLNGEKLTLEGEFKDETAFSFLIPNMYILRFILVDGSKCSIAISKKIIQKGTPYEVKSLSRGTHRFDFILIGGEKFQIDRGKIGAKTDVVIIGNQDIPEKLKERIADIKHFNL